MENTPKPLENQCLQDENDLKSTVEKLEHTVEFLNRENEWLRKQIGLLQKTQFGKSSEIVHRDQLNIFNEIEVENRPDLEEPTIEKVTHKKRKFAHKGTNRVSFKDLPVIIETYEIPEEERICPCCNGKMHSIGTQSKQTLEYIPARLNIKEVHQHKYACRHCQQKDEKTTFIIAEAPASLIAGSVVSPSLLAHIINQKFNGALPFDRQERLLKRWTSKSANKTWQTDP